MRINSNKSVSKKDLKKNLILKAAARVFAENGYIDSSIKNITDEASVAVGTFYTYFNNKEEVLEQIYEEISNMSVKIASNASRYESSDENIVKKFTFGMASVICMYMQNSELSKILFVKPMGINEVFEKKRWQILDEINLYLKGILKHLKSEHLSYVNNLDVTSVIITQSIFGVIAYWLDGKISCDIKEIIFSLCSYHLKALNIRFSDEQVNNYITEIIDLGYEKFYE